MIGKVIKGKYHIMREIGSGTVSTVYLAMNLTTNAVVALKVLHADTGWTPLFVTAGGVVPETGGMLSHGAIVSREYGIPAVTGVRHATRQLHSGQCITVDGKNGVVS